MVETAEKLSITTNRGIEMSTKGKTWIAKKTVKKAFDATVVLRQKVIQNAMIYIHSEKPLIVENEEHHVLHRSFSSNSYVQDYVEDLQELDDIIAKLSKHL
jgi:hypothetical protein